VGDGVNMRRKLLLDIEGQDGVVGYGIDSEIELITAGKNIVPIPENEQTLNIYKLLKENCDLIFCTSQKLTDSQFYPVPSFWIFAVDNDDNCYGTIGGIGDLENKDYPVGYVNRNGMYGRISNNLKDFLELITFYPYWRDIIRYEQQKISYDIREMEMKETNLQYLAKQREIAETLKLSKNANSIELLISNIKREPEFIAYASREEAQAENTFWDTRMF